jgi:type I restriction enzyme R subunit
LGFAFVSIKDENELVANLKSQLERFNKLKLFDREFSKVINHLNKGNVFERAKLLRDKCQLTRDDGTSGYLDFLNRFK